MRDGLDEPSKDEVRLALRAVAVGPRLAGRDAVADASAGVEVLREEQHAPGPVAVHALGPVETRLVGAELVRARVARDAGGHGAEQLRERAAVVGDERGSGSGPSAEEAEPVGRAQREADSLAEPVEAIVIAAAAVLRSRLVAGHSAARVIEAYSSEAKRALARDVATGVPQPHRKQHTATKPAS